MARSAIVPGDRPLTYRCRPVESAGVSTGKREPRANLMVDLPGLAKLQILHPEVGRWVDDLSLKRSDLTWKVRAMESTAGTSLSTYWPGRQT